MNSLKSKIATLAAQFAVTEGLAYGPAKRRAVKQLGLPSRTALPGNEQMEGAVLQYLSIFCAQTQPAKLQALRRLALVWMERMAVFRPYLGGSVWHGTATHLSDIYIELFCDDSKSAEISLLDQQVNFVSRTVTGFHGKSVEVLSVHASCPELKQEVGVHLLVYAHDDVRGALQPDSKGHRARGDTVAVRSLLHDR